MHCLLFNMHLGHACTEISLATEFEFPLLAVRFPSAPPLFEYSIRPAPRGRSIPEPARDRSGATEYSGFFRLSFRQNLRGHARNRCEKHVGPQTVARPAKGLALLHVCGRPALDAPPVCVERFRRLRRGIIAPSPVTPFSQAGRKGCQTRVLLQF